MVTVIANILLCFVAKLGKDTQNGNKCALYSLPAEGYTVYQVIPGVA